MTSGESGPPSMDSEAELAAFQADLLVWLREGRSGAALRDAVRARYGAPYVEWVEQFDPRAAYIAHLITARWVR